MVNRIRLIAIIIMAIMLSACSTISDSVSGWLDESYEMPPAELTEFTSEFEPTIAWSTDTGDGASNEYSDLSVWLDSGVVVTVDQEGEVSSYAADTGSQKWRTDLDVRIYTGVGGGSEHVFVGSQEGEVFALNKSDGKLIWQQQVTSEVLAPPKSANNVVVVRTSDGRLTGLSTVDGEKLWSYQRAVPLLSLRGAGAPVIVGDKVIAGYANGKLVALSIDDGKVIWEKSVAVPRGRSELERIVDIDATPVIKSGNVYVVTYQGKAAGLSVETGQILWSRDMSSRSGLDVIVNDAVYISDGNSYVWAVRDGSGDALWRQVSLLRRKISAPVVVGPYLLVGDFEGYLHWISREDGRFVARRKVSDAAIVSKPVVSDDLVYVMATDGKLTVFRI